VLGTRPRRRVAIPTGLAGVSFYCQAIALDSSANALGLVLSNGADGRIGG
jgi:hypothetical protein